jgi:hypothetical protein
MQIKLLILYLNLLQQGLRNQLSIRSMEAHRQVELNLLLTYHQLGFLNSVKKTFLVNKGKIHDRRRISLVDNRKTS